MKNDVGNDKSGKAITGKILLVDDDTSLLELLSIFLESMGHQVTAHANPEGAISDSINGHFDLIISDLRMGPIDGIALMNTIQELDTPPPVIIITAHGCIPGAVTAMRNGAFHYLTKPFANKELQMLVIEALQQNSNLKNTESLRQSIKQNIQQGYIYKSPKTLELMEQISRFADNDSSVFLTGESGTGKDVTAKSLHQLSTRADQPFLGINCGAIPENLLESELFGHVKGAFTGATRHHDGLFSRANGGTVLLDEIGDLPLPLQVKLLRFLQERKIQPIGSSREIPIDVRIVSATHMNIKEMILNNDFREDLYYRLYVIPIHIPPLRERREDIPLLAQSFLDQATAKHIGKIHGFTSAAMEKLITRSWPGNIRELLNVVEYVSASVEKGWIDADIIPDPLRTSDNSGHLAPLVEAKAQFEKEYLEHLMRVTKGNVAQSARIAGRYRPDLYKLLRKHSIQQADFKENSTH